MSEEKPKASWPCPEQFSKTYGGLAAEAHELQKLRDKLRVRVAKFEATCAETWQEVRESLANMYPDQIKMIYGAVGLHFNEDAETIESWTQGEGPFKSEVQEAQRFPIMLNMTPDAGKDSGGSVIDKSSEILGEELGRKRKRDLDLGLDSDSAAADPSTN